MRNSFRLKKENKATKDRVIRDIRNLFEDKEEDDYKPVRVGNLWSDNYFECKSNDNQNKTLCLKKIINNIKKFGRGKFN